MTTDGSQVAGAQDRYRKGTVKKPVGVKTTTGGSGSGGGSGSSSGGNSARKPVGRGFSRQKPRRNFN